MTKEDLQKKISNLENYCEKQELELNLDKIKVMIFDKKGSTVKNYKFHFQGKNRNTPTVHIFWIHIHSIW